MIVIKSVNRLGDAIHAYSVVRYFNDNKLPSKLLTSTKWHNLFDLQYITTDRTNIAATLDADINLTIPKLEQFHSRDRFTNLFLKNNKAPSVSLEILPTSFEIPTIMLCQRSFRNYKSWNGDWQAIEKYLKNKNFKVLYDLPTTSVESLVGNIAGSTLIVSVDSAPVHIADSYGTPVIGLYGATSLHHYGPHTDQKYCIERKSMHLITIDDIIEKIDMVIRGLA